jgi:hypothetical protein
MLIERYEQSCFMDRIGGYNSTADYGSNSHPDYGFAFQPTNKLDYVYCYNGIQKNNRRFGHYSFMDADKY